MEEKLISKTASNALPIAGSKMYKETTSPMTMTITRRSGNRHRNEPLTKIVSVLLLVCICLLIPFSPFKERFGLSGEQRKSVGSMSQKQQQLQTLNQDESHFTDRLADSINKTRLRERLRYLTLVDRVAGSEGSYTTAEWVRDIYTDAGLDDVHIQSIPVYINYPTDQGRQVAVVSNSSGHGYSWIAKLEEEPLYGNDSEIIQTPAFHGYSREGNVTGPLIYANYGSMDDFRTLTDTFGLNLTGTIALVRYNGTQSDRSLKVKAAEMAGAIGCLIYSDPMEDGFKLGPAYPNGPYRPSDGVQRGSVALSSWVVGDPLTPGWASSNDSKTASKKNNPGLVNIPSLPLAWRDAQPLLQFLKGHGKIVPQSWVGGVPDVDEWWSGSQASPLVNLQNIQHENDKQPIYNVFGDIKGWESEQTVYVGNHRDAWCQGASDPASGTVAMLEVVNLLGELKKTGWTPRRTISFASWDGEEYNFLGSTEFVEGHLDKLRQQAVAYLNVDVGVVGGTFRANGSPLFEKVLMKVLGKVVDPYENRTLQTLWKERDGAFAGLAAGSDYVAFQDIAGISSIDFGFEGPGYPAPYHSCYESFEWMERFGDPGFAYHKTLVHFWTLMILELADSPILPFDAKGYAAAVRGYVQDLKSYAPKIDFGPLERSSDYFIQQAVLFHGSESGAHITPDSPTINRKLIQLERDMLDLSEGGGVSGREQYKHIIFGPQAWGGYDEAYFPAILDAIDGQDGDWIDQQVGKAAKILTRAAARLTI